MARGKAVTTAERLGRHHLNQVTRVTIVAI